MEQALGAQAGLEGFLPRFIGNQQLVIFKHHSVAYMSLYAIFIQVLLSHLAFLLIVKRCFVQV